MSWQDSRCPCLSGRSDVVSAPALSLPERRRTVRILPGRPPEVPEVV
ncbi:MAG: hypothetical protein AVDCRST_MAG33-2172 [uncultured Thermomicrobiales bacterium]|uniref:Uncharacterized protein n=1 Tax=uncultured Thermomicrobiales bacterium TaxID=1645740 RepID=A0A6J4V565_9BACT|nr:MAG: hypothetical protein AVDCRST_MAG33-2172 [uncultured Thermomicrobiales bacterium]